MLHTHSILSLCALRAAALFQVFAFPPIPFTLSTTPVNHTQGSGNALDWIKGAVSRYSVIFCAFLREQKMAVARASVADVRPAEWELCKITSCSVTSEAGELQGSCLTRHTAMDVQTMIGRTLCSSWLTNISWIFFSKTIV